MTTLSVVVPAKNEEATIGHVFQELYQTLPKLRGCSFEVICVDDKCSDRTAEIARAFGARVVRNEGPSGKGMALRKGFEAATGDLILMLDADFSHRAEEIPAMLAEMKPGVGLVIGSRVVGGSEEYTHIRALGNVFLSAALGVCTRRYLSDALNGFKLFRADVFKDFKYTSKAFEIEIEIIANVMRKGYRIVEVSSHERARAGGEMKSRAIRHGTRFLARIVWEGLRGVRPAGAAAGARRADAEVRLEPLYAPVNTDDSRIAAMGS